VEVVPDRRPGSLARTEDELVEELDGEQQEDEPSELAGCAGHALVL